MNLQSLGVSTGVLFIQKRKKEEEKSEARTREEFIDVSCCLENFSTVGEGKTQLR